MKLKHVLLATALTVSGMAHADDTESLNHRFQLKFGAGILTAQSGRDFLGKSPLGGEVGYDLGRVAGGTWGLYVAGLYYNRGFEDDRRVFTTIERDVSAYGLQYRSRPTRQGFYMGGGLGYYTVSSTMSTDLGNVVTSNISDDSAWGSKVFVGKNLSKHFFLEAGYTHIRALQLSTGPRRNMSHTTFFLGYRN